MSSIFIRTIIIYLLLSILLKVMGKRQIGELVVNDLVSTLLISEIASIPISDSDIPILSAIIPIIFIAMLEILISALKNKWHGLKHIVEGEPIYIIYKGKLMQNALAENRISINEVLTEMRTQGIGSISDVYYGILEQNGKLSLLKVDDKDNVAHTVIIDGAYDKERLKHLGYDEIWLEKQLKCCGVSQKEVFLMSVTDMGVVNIIKKEVNR